MGTDWHAPQVVVIDFGLANHFSTRSAPGGTPGYMPPEVWEYGLWTPKGDVFSIGVMMFSLRTARAPFTENCTTMEEVIEKTKKDHPVMNLGSSAIKELTMSMLEKDFRRRIALNAVIQHPFFASVESDDQVLGSDVLAKLSQASEVTE